MNIPEVAHYRVERLIGVGGMGEVYLAEDTRLRRKVALKLLPDRFEHEPQRIRRFQREARAASALNHPNILTIYEVGEAGRRHYIATEYIDGQTLRDRIELQEPMSATEVLDIAIAVVSALAAAHGAGIVHRDIKPENIMLRRDGYVKVLDFGLAKLVDSDSNLRDSTTGAVMGTLLYISPEQARGITPDHRSDIYSVGAVMYEMLTRQPPIVTDSFVEMAMAIAAREPQPPSAVARGQEIPPQLDQIVLKALQKDRERRYQTAEEMLRDLQTLRQELEFERKLSGAGPERRISGPLYGQTTAPLAFGSSSSDVFSRLRRMGGRKGGMITAAVLSAFVVAYAIVRNARGSGDVIESVAVLPFENASGDPDNEYLSDGLAESVIDSLSRLPDLQVTARSTVFRYKGQKVDPLAAGRALNVRGVVSGTLRQRGDTLIIRASLTDVKKGTQVWGEQYARTLADVLSIQREMAQQISTELRLRLTGEQKEMIARRAGANSEAFRIYLKGRYHRAKYTEEGVRRAIEFYNQAIEVDPSYALAYAGLADAYYGLSNVWMAPKEAMPRARQAAQRALELDETLPEAHTGLALVLIWYDWNFAAGEQQLRRALDLNPNAADSRRVYGDYLLATGQFDRALAEKKKAEEIDPLSVPASWDVGRALFYAGRIAEAEEQLRRTLELDERFALPYLMRAQIAFMQGRHDDALGLVEKAISVGGRTPFNVSMWGYINARLGRSDVALKAIAELRSRQTYLLPLFLARVYAGLGNDDEAIRLLEELFEEKSESVVWLKVDTTLAQLREDPRFVALIERVGL